MHPKSEPKVQSNWGSNLWPSDHEQYISCPWDACPNHSATRDFCSTCSTEASTSRCTAKASTSRCTPEASNNRCSTPEAGTSRCTAKASTLVRVLCTEACATTTFSVLKSVPVHPWAVTLHPLKLPLKPFITLTQVYKLYEWPCRIADAFI